MYRSLLIYSLIISVSFASIAAGQFRVEFASAQSSSPTPSASVSPTASPKVTPTVSPSVSPTVSPSVAPTASPTVSPTASPSPSPEPEYEPVGDKIRVWQLRWKKQQKTEQPVAPVARKTNKKTSWLAERAHAQSQEIYDEVYKPNTSSGSSGSSGTFGLTGGQAAGAAAVGAIAAGASGDKNLQGVTGAIGTAGGVAQLVGASSVAGPLFIAAAAVGIVGAIVLSFFGGEDLPPNRVQTCIKKEFKAGYHSKWNGYYEAVGVKIENNNEYVTGRKKLSESYIVSNIFTSAEGDAGRFTDLSVLYDKPKKNTLEIYYRSSNEPLSPTPAAEDWTKLPDPEINRSKDCAKKVRIATYPIDITNKYFQYKVHVVPGQEFRAAWFDIQGMKEIKADPTPSPTPSADTDASKKDTGLITINTKRLVLAEKPKSDSGRSTAPLPSMPPTPSPSADPSEPNPACFDDRETEEAAGVTLSIRQTKGGSVKIEDQRTDEAGIWQGVRNDEASAIPVGTYQIKFGDYQREDYKLVDICVEPNDGSVVRKTETSVAAARATVLVKKDIETKVTLLYAPRNKPYITMNMFAINKENKVMKVVFPGVSFRYLVRYENTGDADAKNASIQNVVPEQFYVAGTDQQTLQTQQNAEISVDAYGRSVVKKKVGELKAGQKGSFAIPVTLRPTAFGSPDDIAGILSARNEAVNQQRQSAENQSDGELE